MFDGVWWAIVTISTVGYGDKTPKTTLGRALSMIWMLCTISLVSVFTATISSKLTVNRLESGITSLEDLKEKGGLGIVRFSPAEDYCDMHRIRYQAFYTNPEEGVLDLEKGNIKGFLHDESEIRYLLSEQKMFGKIKIIPGTFNRHFGSWMLPRHNPLFDIVNPLMVDKISTDAWYKTLKKYNL